jgi:hypothetical protein
METAPVDLNCSSSERDAPETIVFISTSATTADNFTRICFTDAIDNDNRNNTYNRNITQPLIPDINSFYFYEVSCFLISAAAMRLDEPCPLRV